MRRQYMVCTHCRQSWIWGDRLMTQPRLTCNQCGTRWQKDHLPDLRKSRKVTWASWNFDGSGQRWPTKTFKEALLEPPPGLHGGQRGKKAKKVKQPAIHKALKDHSNQLPAALKEKCQAMGVVEVEAPVTPDLPTLIRSICRAFQRTSRRR